MSRRIRDPFRYQRLGGPGSHHYLVVDEYKGPIGTVTEEEHAGRYAGMRRFWWRARSSAGQGQDLGLYVGRHDAARAINDPDFRRGHGVGR